MRALMPGAVDIDPVSERRWRRRPPPHSADRAGHRHRHHENKTSDRAAPVAPAARTASCSPRELTTRLRLARAEIPSECGKPSHFSTDPSKRARGSRAGIQSEQLNESRHVILPSAEFDRSIDRQSLLKYPAIVHLDHTVSNVKVLVVMGNDDQRFACLF